jgi:hypothetical protein
MLRGLYYELNKLESEQMRKTVSMNLTRKQTKLIEEARDEFLKDHPAGVKFVIFAQHVQFPFSDGFLEFYFIPNPYAKRINNVATKCREEMEKLELNKLEKQK